MSQYILRHHRKQAMGIKVKRGPEKNLGTSIARFTLLVYRIDDIILH